MVPIVHNRVALVVEHDIVVADVTVEDANLHCVVECYRIVKNLSMLSDGTAKCMETEIPLKTSRKARVYSLESCAEESGYATSCMSR